MTTLAVILFVSDFIRPGFDHEPTDGCTRNPAGTGARQSARSGAARGAADGAGAAAGFGGPGFDGSLCAAQPPGHPGALGTGGKVRGGRQVRACGRDHLQKVVERVEAHVFGGFPRRRALAGAGGRSSLRPCPKHKALFTRGLRFWRGISCVFCVTAGLVVRWENHWQAMVTSFFSTEFHARVSNWASDGCFPAWTSFSCGPHAESSLPGAGGCAGGREDAPWSPGSTGELPPWEFPASKYCERHTWPARKLASEPSFARCFSPRISCASGSFIRAYRRAKPARITSSGSSLSCRKSRSAARATSTNGRRA